MWEVIVDIGGVVDHHDLNFLFSIYDKMTSIKGHIVWAVDKKRTALFSLVCDSVDIFIICVRLFVVVIFLGYYIWLKNI